MERQETRVVESRPAREYPERSERSGQEQVIILGQGGHRMSARDLKEEVSQMEQEIRENYLGRTNSPRNYLFNQLDEKMSALMEDVRLGKKKLE